HHLASHRRRPDQSRPRGGGQSFQLDPTAQLYADSFGEVLGAFLLLCMSQPSFPRGQTILSTADNLARPRRNRSQAIEPTADDTDGADKAKALASAFVARRVSGGTNVLRRRHPALTRRARRCTQANRIFS